MRGIGFLLIPIYTRYLTPQDYGIVALVTSVTAFLSIFYLLGLPSAIRRFYFTDPTNENYVKRLWGTNITFIIIIAFMTTFVLILLKGKGLSLFLGEVPFYPHVILGLITILTLPFFDIYQTTLKIRQLGLRYGLQNVFRFLFQIGLTILFVVFLKYGAVGPLLASALTGTALFLYTFFVFGRSLKWGIDPKILKKSLTYSLPLIPHSLAGWANSLISRVFLSRITSLMDVGLFNIGYMFGSTLNMITAGFNEAFSPYFTEKLEGGSGQDKNLIIKISTIVIGFYCILATFLSLFSKEVITLMTTSEYQSSWVVTPFIAFGNVASGIYRFFVAPLFFNLSGTKYVSIGTFTVAGLNIFFLFYLIPKYGIVGAAFSGFFAELCGAVFIGFIAHLIQPFKWNYVKISFIFFISISSVGLTLLYIPNMPFLSAIIVKLIICVIMTLFIFVITMGGPQEIIKNFVLIREIVTKRIRT